MCLDLTISLVNDGVGCVDVLDDLNGGITLMTYDAEADKTFAIDVNAIDLPLLIHSLIHIEEAKDVEDLDVDDRNGIIIEDWFLNELENDLDKK